MAATYHERNYTIGGNTVYLKYIKCNHGDITVRSINGSVRDSGFCGINGTFFRSGNLAGIAINSGAQVRNYGTKNRDPLCGYNHTYSCGTFFVLENQTSSGIFLGTDEIDTYHGHSYNGTTLTISNTRFAIGGTSLFPSESIANEAAYLQLINSEDPPAPSDERPRTAIIYIGGDYYGQNTVLLTVHGNVNSGTADHKNTDNEGVSLWQLRTIINNVFAPMMPGSPSSVTHAIALDGGGSTQIAYKTSSGVYKSYQIGSEAIGYNRTVYSMLSVSMD